MIRLTTPDDLAPVTLLLEATGLFEMEEVEEVADVLSAHFIRTPENQDLWLTDDKNGPVGVAYAAPERMTKGTWNIYLLAIHPDYQRQGRGSALLRHIEQTLAAQGERLLLVETLGIESFEQVRAFYRKNGFEEEGRIREFYAAGADKVIFRKAL